LRSEEVQTFFLKKDDHAVHVVIREPYTAAMAAFLLEDPEYPVQAVFIHMHQGLSEGPVLQNIAESENKRNVLIYRSQQFPCC
jgi:hypothetical protein